jgi:Fe2+ transport system protein FeoA
LKLGEKGKLVQIKIDSQRLQEMGLVKGVVISVISTNLICMICNTKVCMNKSLGEQILVEKI